MANYNGWPKGIKGDGIARFALKRLEYPSYRIRGQQKKAM
jgi:hypothetical protein